MCTLSNILQHLSPNWITAFFLSLKWRNAVENHHMQVISIVEKRGKKQSVMKIVHVSSSSDSSDSQSTSRTRRSSLFYIYCICISTQALVKEYIMRVWSTQGSMVLSRLHHCPDPVGWIQEFTHSCFDPWWYWFWYWWWYWFWYWWGCWFAVLLHSRLSEVLPGSALQYIWRRRRGR